jgi:hypothetical protein
MQHRSVLTKALREEGLSFFATTRFWLTSRMGETPR